MNSPTTGSGAPRHDLEQVAAKLLGAAGTLDADWSLRGIRRKDDRSIYVDVLPRSGGKGLCFLWAEPEAPAGAEAFVVGERHTVSVVGGAEFWSLDDMPAKVKRRAVKGCRSLGSLRHSVGIAL